MNTFHEIPQIDLSPLLQDGNAGIYEVAEKMREAFTQVGFAYIYNHGVSEALVSAAFKASKDFHSLPEEEKLKIKQNKFFRGYLPLASSTLKVSTLGDAKKPNQSEAFIMAHDVDADDPDFLAETNLAGPNQWPLNNHEFKNIISQYNSKMLQLSRKLVQVFSVAFGLDVTSLDCYVTKPTTFLRLQYYPEQPDFIPADQFGIAPHTDHGLVTILAQDNQGGLQVRNNQGDWIDAPPIPGTFVLNTGDMLKRLSNDTYISTPHRVINHSGAKRYSLPFFLEPNMHVSIAPLPDFCSKEEPAKYAPMEYCEHLMKRIRRNYDIGA